METKKERTEDQLAQDAREYPGVAINAGDDGKDDASLVKERTKALNNNPRNDDGPKD